MTQPYDMAVIGAGPGGYVAALKAAQMGARTVLIEKGLIGGVCLNRGCIPSKVFLGSAELLHDLRHRAPLLGIRPGEPTFEWPVLLERKNQVLDEQRRGLRHLFKKRDIALLEGQATLEGPGRIAVRQPKGAAIVTARHVIIAAGSVPSRIPGWPESERIETSDEALDWQALPSTLLIVGGGVIGCEFACFLAEFGVRVTIVEMLPRLLPNLDEDLGAELLKVFKKRGIACHLGTKVEDLRLTEAAVNATLSDGTKLQADKVLVATGRRAVTEGLGLEHIGAKMNRGFVVVNDAMETGAPGHYAVGDINGRCLLAHSASAMGHLAVENALESRAKPFDAPNPWCVYTFPEIAGVGLGESEARQKGLPIAVGVFPFSASGKAKAHGDSAGFVKVVRHRETDRILGVHAVGHAATEFIAAAGTLIHTQATAHDIVAMIFAHPTMSEAVREAAEMSLFAGLHMPPSKKVRIAV